MDPKAEFVRDALGCTVECAEAIAAVMYTYVCPDFSEASWADLRRDFKTAARLGGIPIVSDPAVKPKKD